MRDKNNKTDHHYEIGTALRIQRRFKRGHLSTFEDTFGVSKPHDAKMIVLQRFVAHVPKGMFLKSRDWDY